MSSIKTFTPALTKAGKPCKRCLKAGAFCFQHKPKAPGAPKKAAKPVEKKLDFDAAPQKKLDFAHQVCSPCEPENEDAKVRFQSEDEIPKTKAGKPCKRCMNKQALCWQHVNYFNKVAPGAPKKAPKPVAKKLDFDPAPKKKLTYKQGRKAPAESANEFEVGDRKEGLDGNIWEIRTVTRKASECTYKRWFKVAAAALALIPGASAEPYVLADRETDGDFLFALKFALIIFCLIVVLPELAAGCAVSCRSSSSSYCSYRGRQTRSFGSYPRKYYSKNY